jgi:acyl-CoA synthetase (AMP-forming)/AMP-acid ligase II
MRFEDLKAQDFGTLPDLIRYHARARPDHAALADAGRLLAYGELDRLMDRIAAALQREGVAKGQVMAICAAASIEYGAVFLGALRAGAVVAPLAPTSSPASLKAMLDDCNPTHAFVDSETGESICAFLDGVSARLVSLDGSDAGLDLQDWLAPPGSVPSPVDIEPLDPFNIIYSSGTTGTPKGIVQPHRLRWNQFFRAEIFSMDAVTLVSTPLYSNTTLVSFLPTLASGGTVLLMPKFEGGEFLRLSEEHRVTHAMLVPVQYRRLMERADFDDYDLSSYRVKFSTSAPFAASLKAEVLRRWPGGLVEFYGMTEGGGSCVLLAHEHPDKLDTVGQPVPGHDIRLIDEQGEEVPRGALGEVVGRSPAMMTGYHNRPEQTRAAEWISPEGLRFIRTGDVGRFDGDGFLTLLDRKKDLIISGGFNIYPSDIEAELVAEPGVVEAAVVGVPSELWGETPVAFVVPAAGSEPDPEALRRRVNERLGKTQRLADLRFVASLPRSPIGKVLKRELRDSYAVQTAG